MLIDILYEVFDFMEIKDIVKLYTLNKRYHEIVKKYIQHRENRMNLSKKRIIDVILRNESNNLILTAPTQCGKTQFLIDIIKRLQNCIVVIVSENRTDQQKQLQQRFRKCNLPLTSVSEQERPMIQRSLNKGNRVCFSVLNNTYRIKALSSVLKKITFKNLVVFKDEADTQLNTSTKSFKDWENLEGFLLSSGINIKTYYVTATYGKCLRITDNIIKLPVPNTYRSINQFTEWDGEDMNPLLMELNRVRKAKSNEFILFSVTAVIMKQLLIAREISNVFPCVCITYNCNGIRIFESGSHRKYNSVILSKALDEFKNYHKPVVVVGGGMIKRGLSFCGAKSPMVATVLFYHTKNIVTETIVQKFGRVTGTFRPDIKDRRIYASKSMINRYKKYMEMYEEATSAIDSN